MIDVFLHFSLSLLSTPCVLIQIYSSITCFENDVLRLLLFSFYFIFPSIIVVIQMIFLIRRLIHVFIFDFKVFNTEFRVFILLKPLHCSLLFLSIEFLALFFNAILLKSFYSGFLFLQYNPIPCLI